MCALLLLLPAPALLGQTIQLSSTKASRGGRFILQLSLASPAGHQPLGVQWEMSFPADRFILLENGAAPSRSARAAGKTATCASKPPVSGASGAKCILIGGQQPMPNGLIANIALRVLPNAPKGPARIHLDPGMAVFKGMMPAPLDAVESTVTIR